MSKAPRTSSSRNSASPEQEVLLVSRMYGTKTWDRLFCPRLAVGSVCHCRASVFGKVKPEINSISGRKAQDTIMSPTCITPASAKTPKGEEMEDVFQHFCGPTFRASCSAHLERECLTPLTLRMLAIPCTWSTICIDLSAFCLVAHEEMSAEPVFDRTPTFCNVAWQTCTALRYDSATHKASCSEAARAARF